MARGRKATRQNTFPLDKFVIFQLFTFLLCTSFGAPLLSFFISIDHSFTPHVLILLHISNLYSLKLVQLSISYALIMQFGQTKSFFTEGSYLRIICTHCLFIWLLMIELAFSSNIVIGYMHMHITRVDLKGTNFPRMAYITSCWLCCL